MFFLQVVKQGFKHILESPTPPPPPLQWHKACTHSVLVLKDRNPTWFGDGQRDRRGVGKGGGGGGGRIIPQFCPYFSAFLKKHRDIFYHKMSWHAKFQWNLSNLKNHNEIHFLFTSQQHINAQLTSIVGFIIQNAETPGNQPTKDEVTSPAPVAAAPLPKPKLVGRFNKHNAMSNHGVVCHHWLRGTGMSRMPEVVLMRKIVPCVLLDVGN